MVVNLMDPQQRQAWIDDAATIGEKISRGQQIPDFDVVLGWTWQHRRRMAQAGFVPNGSCKSTSSYGDPWKELAVGVKYGAQSSSFESRTGRRRRYTMTIQPDGTIAWKCQNSGKWVGQWSSKLVAEGTDFDSMLAHAEASPRPLTALDRKVYA